MLIRKLRSHKIYKRLGREKEKEVKTHILASARLVKKERIESGKRKTCLVSTGPLEVDHKEKREGERGERQKRSWYQGCVKPKGRESDGKNKNEKNEKMKKKKRGKRRNVRYKPIKSYF